MSGDEPGSSRPKEGMDWMYRGPAALVDREEYLTGRTVDKALKILEEAEKGNSGYSYLDEVEKDLTPASIFASSGGGPTDIIRKVKEDPLYQIQKKEEEYLRQLLTNPVKMKQLRQLAEQRKEEEKKKSSGSSQRNKKDRKRRSSSSSDSDDDSNIDKILAQKLSSLKNASDILKKRTKSSSDSDDSSDKVRSAKSRRFDEQSSRGRYRRGESDGRREQSDRRDSGRRRSRSRERRRERSRERSRSRDRRRSRSRDRATSSKDKRSDSRSDTSRRPGEKKKVLDETERERKLREMMENAQWREKQRTENVMKHREELKKEEEKLKSKQDADFIRKQLVEAADKGSVEKRIQSKSYSIQRSKASMDQHFARR